MPEITSGRELSKQVKSGEFFHEEDFSAMDCKGVDLSGGIFAEVCFDDCDFSGANLKEATFANCSIKSSIFFQTNLNPSSSK
ncbi:pentapeptide repeat-containing protein [Desulfobacula sp.]|uniref:pentapeptide repeat-containing protein n=1 Tax=Desulfobacula sp. TaxID=2593537 RepID=UPI002633634F|nr:pentapeptide repeat-containing protein [Desulfobacula sp.]